MMKQHSQSCTTFKPSADSPKQANTQPKLLHPDDICVYIYIMMMAMVTTSRMLLLSLFSRGSALT